MSDVRKNMARNMSAVLVDHTIVWFYLQSKAPKLSEFWGFT